jgi:hypothetical protein
LELQKSQEIARSLDVNEIENLLYYFEADLTNALNLAGMKALKEIGKHPVITSSLGTGEAVNYYRVKNMIKDELNVYLSGHYLYNMFSNGRYAINVVLRNETPILSIENIRLESCSMQLKRFTIPFIGPRETMNHSTYWVASVPLAIEIRQLNGYTWELLATRTVLVSSILTSRYPLLENLIKEYNQTINGTFSPLWTFSTVLSNLNSLVRGFKHYRCGKPLNVMDNRHLSVIINSGLLLEQSLVFGSVDPIGLVDLARKIKQTLKQIPPDALTTFNNEMTGEGYSVETENLTTGGANVDAGSPINESIDLSPSLNLSDIAERILYNISSATLHFENEGGESDEELIIFDGDVHATINEVIQRQANQSFFLTRVMKHLSVNTTTLHMLQAIISEIYCDTMSTQVYDRFIGTEQSETPGEGWTDGGTSPWNATSIIPLLKEVIKPPKGQITPGCAVYEEYYNVSYERLHYWWRIEEYPINGTMILIKVWNNRTDLLVETVILHSLLQHYASYNDSQDDIVDVLYVNMTLNDPNLEDTLNTYLALYQDSEGEKQELITTRNNSGTIGLEAIVQGLYSGWVLDEVWSVLEEILESIRKITLDPSIDAEQYPNPTLLVEKAKSDLLTKYNEHISEYLDFSQYHPGPQFCSVGKKAVYYSREWYVHVMKNATETVFSQISQQLTNTIDATIPPYADFNTKNITETLDDASDALQNQFTIPFGYAMNLTRYDARENPLWNETIRLAVDQYPNYLDPFEKTQWEHEELWTIKIRNRCMLGPTGLPILPPSPVTPWVLTLNLWVIDVQGEYPQFKLIDTSDETIFNPILGHEPQTYVRELKIISAANVTLGENTRLSFGFTTVAFGLVPPWGMMLGDIQENWYDDHTFGFDEG